MGQSTDVIMESWSRPKRLPGYWFESRRRYLAASLNTAATMTADVLVLLAYPLGYLKQILLGRRHTTVPHYLGDLWRHSILRVRNRRQAPLMTYMPAGQAESRATPPQRMSASGAPLG